MKKLLTMTLALMLLVTTIALADVTYDIQETSPHFGLKITLEDGATIEQNAFDDVTVAHIILPNAAPDAIDYTLTVAYSDIYADLHMNELSDDDLTALFMAIAGYDGEVSEAVTYKLHDLDDCRIMVIYDANADFNIASAVTLIDGYIVSMYCMYDDFRAVTEADVELAVRMLDRIEIDHAEH